MESFGTQLKAVYPSLERYVKYRLDGISDAEDLIQDICLTANLKYGQLQKQESFKPWSEKLPDNERLDINGQTFVHWYDCVSDYILSRNPT